MCAGGTLSATRASSRASSRSGCTSGTLEEEPRRGSRRAPTPASRAGAARAAAILLISRHLGGAHPPKCAAKGETDNVCAMGSSARRVAARAFPNAPPCNPVQRMVSLDLPEDFALFSCRTGKVCYSQIVFAGLDVNVTHQR